MNNFQKFYFDITGFRDEMKGAVKRYQVTIKELERFKGSAGYDEEMKRQKPHTARKQRQYERFIQNAYQSGKKIVWRYCVHIAIHCQRRSRLQLYKP